MGLRVSVGDGFGGRVAENDDADVGGVASGLGEGVGLLGWREVGEGG